MIVQSAWPTSIKETFRTPGSLTEVAGVGLGLKTVAGGVVVGTVDVDELGKVVVAGEIKTVDKVGMELEVVKDALFDVIGLLVGVTDPWQPKESTRTKIKITANKYRDFFNLNAS
jgi:hypothetical protein